MDNKRTLLIPHMAMQPKSNSAAAAASGQVKKDEVRRLLTRRLQNGQSPSHKPMKAPAATAAAATKRKSPPKRPPLSHFSDLSSMRSTRRIRSSRSMVLALAEKPPDSDSNSESESPTPPSMQRQLQATGKAADKDKEAKEALVTALTDAASVSTVTTVASAAEDKLKSKRRQYIPPSECSSHTQTHLAATNATNPKRGDQSKSGTAKSSPQGDQARRSQGQGQGGAGGGGGEVQSLNSTERTVLRTVNHVLDSGGSGGLTRVPILAAKLKDPATSYLHSQAKRKSSGAHKAVNEARVINYDVLTR